MEHQSFQKIARLTKPVVITEKLDGTNAQVYIENVKTSAAETGESFDQIKYGDKDNVFVSDEWIIKAGSRNRWITPENDHFGFALWVKQNSEDLLKLGPGRHFGEWWGVGIQRGYGLHERRFSLFNTSIWNEETKPKCCHVVPTLHTCILTNGEELLKPLFWLSENGSAAAPGYMNPEGIIIYHTGANIYFKKTFEKDEGKYKK